MTFKVKDGISVAGSTFVDGSRNTTTNDLTVGGNLTVSGTTTTINTATLEVADLNITVAKNATTAAAANGAGLTVAGASATLLYTSAADSWNFNKNVFASNLSGTNTGDNPGVTSVAAVTPIVSSGGTTPSISHATSGVGAGTYNNVTVNTFGHVTAGSNTAYLTTLTDTLATVTGRGATTTTAVILNGGLSTGSASTGVTRAVVDTGGNFLSYYAAETTARIQLGRDVGISGGAGLALGGALYALIASSDTNGSALYFKLNTAAATASTSPNMSLTSTGLSVAGTLTASNLSGTNTGDNPGVTSVAGVTPIVSSGGTTPSISHATSGVGAGTYNNVTVNTFGHVTAGSNVGYLTGESDTLQTVMSRGATTSTTYVSTNAIPLTFQSNGNTGTYTQTVIYANQNNTTANTANGIFIERGRLTDSVSAEIRYLTIGARGGQIQWQIDGSGNTTQTGTIGASNFSGSHSGTSSGTNTGDNAGVTSVAGVTPIVSSGGTTPSISHATSGATAGTYNNVTVNTFGHVTAGSNAGYLTAESDTLATVTARGASTSTAVTLSSSANHYNGHFYYDPYDAAGNHYPHFTDGGSASGVKINWRLYAGANNTVTHTWTTSLATFATNIAATNFSGSSSGTNTGDNPGVTSVAGVTPIVSSGGTTPSISHATSGVGAGTYNNVTVNTFGHVTAGSNTAYLTAESDTLATVTARGNTTTTSIQASNLNPAYSVSNFDTIKAPGLYQYDGAMTSTPNGDANYRTIEIGNNGRYSQIALNYSSDGMWFRRQTDANWSTWRQVWHSGNLTNLNQLTNGPGYGTGTVTSVATSGGYGGLTLTGGTITTTGTITMGGTPTGTWPISVSGNAATAGNAATVTNATFIRQFTMRDDRSDGGDYSLSNRPTGLYAISGAGTNGPGTSYLSLIHVANGSDVAFQIAGGYNSDNMYFRGTSALQNGTGYSAWRTVLHSGNYTNYAATSGHNHQYNVNNDWLRDNNDDANVKLYGNTRQMAFRTDGTTEFATGVGGYPFAWMYGGDTAAQRLMLLNTTGDMWTSTNGWLSTALAGKQNTGSYLTTESDTLATVTGRGATTGTAITLSGALTLSNTGLFLNRSSGASTGISWYSSGYTTWSTYMAAGAATSVGPTGNITAPTGTLVTSWALRNTVENAAGYGWTWESGTSSQTAPTIVAELRSSDGAMKISGAFTASNFSGSHSGTSSGTNTGDNPGVTSVAGVTPIVSSGGTTPSISHATSGATAGTYNNVTVNTFGHVTAGSNVGYISGYTETDTLATVTGRGATTSTNVSLNGGVSSYMGDAGVLFQSYNASASNAAQFSISHALGAVTIANARGTITLNGNVTGSSGSTTGNAATATNSSQLNGLSKIQLWNNSGQVHSTYATFAAIPDFGVWYMQNSAAADTPQTGSQYYVQTQGLGNDYAYSSYALMTAVARDHAVKYTYYRAREGTTWGAWVKAAAGYADTAGSSTNASSVYQSTDPGAGTYRLLLGNGTNAQGTVYNKSALYWNDTGSIIQGANISGNATTATTATTANKVNSNSGYVRVGTGMAPFYNWGGTNIGAGAPSDASYTTGIDVGSHPSDQAYGFQIASNMWNVGLWTRTYNASFGAWVRILDSSNYNSYAPTLTGTGASGTWGISVTGTSNNITAYTINQNVGTGNSPTFSDIYANAWLRNNINNTGLYNSNTTQHWSSQTNGYWDASSTTSVSAIRFYTGGHVTTLRGHVYANSSNEIGFLNSGGSWSLKMDNSGNAIATGTITANSDERLKKDWTNLPSNFVEQLSKVKNGTYTRIDTDVRQAGSSAQDWQLLLPEVVIVANDEDKTLSLAYGNAALVSAIELAKEVVTLNARIARLEALVSKLIEAK